MPIPPDTKPDSPPDPAGRTHDELVAEVSQLRMEVAYLKKLRALVQAQQQQRATTRKKRK
jgi:transposase